MENAMSNLHFKNLGLSKRPFSLAPSTAVDLMHFRVMGLSLPLAVLPPLAIGQDQHLPASDVAAVTSMLTLLRMACTVSSLTRGRSSPE